MRSDQEGQLRLQQKKSGSKSRAYDQMPYSLFVVCIAIGGAVYLVSRNFPGEPINRTPEKKNTLSIGVYKRGNVDKNDSDLKNLLSYFFV